MVKFGFQHHFRTSDLYLISFHHKIDVQFLKIIWQRTHNVASGSFDSKVWLPLKSDYQVTTGQADELTNRQNLKKSDH